MKKKLFLLLSLLGIFTFASCQNDNSIPGGGNVQSSSQQSSSDPLPDSEAVINGTINYTGFYEDNLRYDFTYKDEYFKNSAVELNQALAKLSLCNALTGTNSKPEGDYDLTYSYVENFYKRCGFSRFDVSSGYLRKPTKESIGFFVGKKELVFNNKKYTVLGITVRGFKYEAEWASNFNLGGVDNHEGFDKASKSIMDSISGYISSLKNERDVKVWITGYSRGGAVAGLTATKLIKRNLISEDNLYCYTFEAPASLEAVDKTEYKSIHNYVNPNDIVPKIIHPIIGIIRPGIDIDYTNGKNIDDVKAKLAEISQKVVFAEVKGDEKLPEFLDNTMKTLYTSIFYHRGFYVSDCQETAMYISEFILGLPKAKRTQLFDYFKSLSFLQLVSLLSVESGKALFKTAFETCQIEYDEATFNTHYEKLLNLVVNKVIPAIGGVALTNVYNNISVIAQNHFAEITLAYMMA